MNQEMEKLFSVLRQRSLGLSGRGSLSVYAFPVLSLAQRTIFRDTNKILRKNSLSKW